MNRHPMKRLSVYRRNFSDAKKLRATNANSAITIAMMHEIKSTRLKPTEKAGV